MPFEAPQFSTNIYFVGEMWPGWLSCLTNNFEDMSSKLTDMYKVCELFNKKKYMPPTWCFLIKLRLKIVCSVLNTWLRALHLTCLLHFIAVRLASICLLWCDIGTVYRALPKVSVQHLSTLSTHTNHSCFPNSLIQLQLFRTEIEKDKLRFSYCQSCIQKQHRTE